MDGANIDGRCGGLSRLVFSSLHGRDRLGAATPLCDVSWTDDDARPVNPLSVGQIVNNGDNKGFSSNVTYHELDVQADFPPLLRQFLPNVQYESVAVNDSQIRWVYSKVFTF